MRLFRVRIILIVVVFCGLMACGNMDDASLVQDDFDPALLEQTEPEFSNYDFEEIENNYEFVVDTVGTWKISRVNGVIIRIRYGYPSSPAAHETPEAFFNECLPLTADNQMIKDPEKYRTHTVYRLYYKGLPVEKCTWFVDFKNDGTMYNISGWFEPINNLDVTPNISEANAKKIVENYRKVSVEGENKRFYLAVMSFPVNGEMVPRLVYVYKYDPWEEHDYVYVDAKTGRLLYHLPYHGDYPYY
jgi:hypothetical protein